MRGYVSAVEADGSGRVPVESGVEVYRVDDGTNRVVANTGEKEVDLGVADATVSRKKGDTAPVEIAAQSEFLEVRNVANSNGVTVRSEGEGKVRRVEDGSVEPVKRDAVVEIGYQTSLRLVVERTARDVTNVHYSGEGDVVMGSKNDVDKSTSVDDAVVKGDIGAGGDGDPASGGPTVETTDVVTSSGGRSERDASTDTQQFCKRHERPYTGRECPECAATDGSDGSEDPSAGGSDDETKFCMYCGESIPAMAKHCPSCGEQLPS